MELKISNKKNPKIQVSKQNNTLKLHQPKTVNTSSSTQRYTGETTVIPDNVEQSLPTKDKILPDDVVVEKVPYFVVSNGKSDTIIIGR